MNDSHNVSRLHPAAMPQAASELASGPAGLPPMEITVFTSRKVLSKTFSAGPDGSGIVKSPGVPFSSGTARCHAIAGGTPEAALRSLAGLLDGLDTHQAIGLGLENSGIGTVELTTRGLAPENGRTPRTLENFSFAEGPGVVLFDYDGGTGFDDLAAEVYPLWADVATLTRGSVSNGVRHGGTGERLSAPGEHIYVVIDDMRLARKAADALEQLFWVHGHGRVMVSASGAALRRSPVDLAVVSPERVIYEGAPVVEAPIEAVPRACAVRPGGVLSAQALIDYAAAHAPKEKADRLFNEACGMQAILQERGRRRAEWLAGRVERRVATGTPRPAAEKLVREFLESAKPDKRGALHYMLDLDEPLTLDDGGTVTPRQIRADPARWAGATMPDPVEGLEYGKCKAMVMRGSVAKGGPFIHSFAHGRTIYQFDAPPHEGGRGQDRREEVYIGSGAFLVVARQCEGLMAEAEVDIFYGSGRLVEPRLTRARDAEDRRIETPTMATVTKEAMLAAMDGVARFYTKTEVKGDVRWKQPPVNIADLLIDRGGKAPWRPLSGIIAAQTMRPDGSILTASGYDAATGLYAMDMPAMPPVSLHPTQPEALAALGVLRDLIGEFHFRDETSRSIALSALMAGLTRASLGRMPMHAFTSTRSGSGKSFLCDVVSILSQGTTCPVVGMPDQRAEFDKQLDGEALLNRPVYCLDNINGGLESDKLCRFLTQDSVSVRALGSSTMHSVRPSGLILANGNGLRIEGDLVRRSLLGTIDTEVENPYALVYKRNACEFTHRERGRLIHACLTVMRAFLMSGEPVLPPSINGFPAWNDNIRSALVWLGQDDPAASLAAMLEMDEGRGVEIALLTAWKDVVGLDVPLTVRELLDASDGAIGGVTLTGEAAAAWAQAHAARQRLAQALTDFAGVKGRLEARALGNRLSGIKDKVVAGYAVRSSTKLDGYRRWQLTWAGGPA